MEKTNHYHRMSLGRRVYKARQLYFLLALPLVYLIVFKYVPMVGVQIAFRDYTIRGGIWGSEWVGFKHFTKLFSDYNFKKIIINTIRLSLYSMTVTTLVPVVLALALNCLRNMKLKKVVQMVTYLPHFVSVVVTVGIINQLFNPLVGLYGNVVQLITGERAVDLMGIPTTFLHMYVWSSVWQHAGYNSVVYIAALAGADQELHEAAQIDGATRLQRVWHVDIPTIIPTVIIILIMNVGSIMSLGFEKTYLMQNALNLSYSEVIPTYEYKKAFGTGGNFSYSTALGLFNSIINFMMIVIVNKISKKVSETSLW